MEYFSKHFSDRLYKGNNSPGDCGEAYLALPSALKGEGDSISLAEAVGNQTGHNGILLFSYQPVSIENQEQADEFLLQISLLIQKAQKTDRAMVWICGIKSRSFSCGFSMGINRDASQVTASLSVPLVRDLSFTVPNGARLNFDGKCIRLDKPGGGCVSFAGANAPAAYLVSSASLPLSGRDMGAFHFNVYFRKSSFLTRLSPGFSMSYRREQSQPPVLRTLPFPMFSKDDSSPGFLSFHACLNPADRYNHTCGSPSPAKGSSGKSARSTYLEFLPDSDNAHPIRSFFHTIYGDPIYLQPVTEAAGGADLQIARFVFSEGPENAPLLSPEGDFLLYNPSGHENHLLCGIEGLESIYFDQGDALRFLSGQPACAPAYPLLPSSTVGEPVDLEKRLLDDTHTTSWASFAAAKNPLYLTQPKGMCYYGPDGSSDSLLSQRETFRRLDRAAFFPLLPFAGVAADRGEAEEFERQIVARERLRLLSSSAPFARVDSSESNGGSGMRIATPGGFLADLDGEGRFANIYLANNDYEGRNYQLYFESPSLALAQAFQSNPLFLVVNNPDFLGAPTSECDARNDPAFHNVINIGDWLFSFLPGSGNEYNNYKTVMIIKGCYGKLYDPSAGGLIANPAAWTEWREFASPLSDGRADPGQLANLSTWLVSYFSRASHSGDAYFSAFNRIAEDENWQGILFLNVPLRQENLPDNMAGVLCGLPGEAELCAHHIGIHMTQLSQSGGSLRQDGNSSLFGLVYYEEPAFARTGKLKPPGPSGYSFFLLSLKALFENSAVTKFENYAQLTLNSWFGLTPERMIGGEYNSVLLNGSYQDQNGTISYALRSVTDCLFYFNASYLNKIEISQVQMETVDPKTKKYRFRINGFLDFTDLQDFDLFSYGNMRGADRRRQGLSFSNLILLLSIQDSLQTFAFRVEEFAPDLRNSSLRPQSLADRLLLKPEGMVSGGGDNTLQDCGYLPVHTGKKCRGVDKEWYGLLLSFPMGSLGELAAKINLSGHLLLAFGPEGKTDEPKISVGIKLPGSGKKAEFLSLQNLLQLSIDQIWLVQEEGAFQLIFTDIALKVFGLLTIPPEGTTNFTLFGGNQRGEEPGWFAKYQKHQNSERGNH